MKQSPFIFSLLCCLALSACSGDGDQNARRPPNFVILFADDLGYGDLSGYGNAQIKTPYLDELAEEGLRFTDFYSASPACTASRYSLLTGRYPVFSGFDWVLYPHSARGIHPQETTIAERLQQAGYATGIVGKWHLGVTDSAYLPLQNGFDEYLGLPYSNDMLPPNHPPIPLIEGYDTIEVMPDQSTLTRRYTERAVDFITRHEKEPFFLYLPYAMPHVPLHPGEAFAGQSPRGPYGDVVEEIDWSAGRIRQTLEELGIAENTLLVFTSDNGPWIIKGADGGSAGPLRDGKGSTWEGGMREPAIAWWPGTIEEGRTTSVPASTLDLYPTLLSLAGLPAEQNSLADGRDISMLLTTTDSLPEAKPFFYYGPGHRLQAVRDGRWKLHVRTNSQTGVDYFPRQIPLLFDLENDPGETRNVAEKHPDIVGNLKKLILSQTGRSKRELPFFEQERQARFSDHLAVGKEVGMLTPFSRRYGPDTLLTDGLPGDPTNLQTLVGVEGDDFIASVDLGETLVAERLRVQFLHAPNKWVFLPEYVEFFISTDGNHFKSRGKIKVEKDTKDGVNTMKPYEVIMRTQPVRYIKVVARNRGTCPPGHPGAGEPAWLMAGEVWVE